MNRDQLVSIAGLLGLKKNAKSEDLEVLIAERLAQINDVLIPPAPKPVLVEGRKPEDGRRGVHPITGKPV